MNFRLSTYRLIPQPIPILTVSLLLTACGSGSDTVVRGPDTVPVSSNPTEISDPIDNILIDATNPQPVQPAIVVEPLEPAESTESTEPPAQPSNQPAPVTEATPDLNPNAPIAIEPQQPDIPLIESESGLTAAQTEQLPDDCLLTQDAEGVAYCFSPATRKYTAVQTDGNVLYDFTLPGDNATNSVKGLFIGPQDSLNDVCLVADVTVSVDDSEFEISCFQSSGAFVDTVPTLTTAPRYGDPVKTEVPQGINVNDEPLLVAQAESGRVFVAGTRYAIAPLADPSQQDAWQREGSFIALLNPTNGQRLAAHNYPNRNISSLDSSGDSLIVTFDDEDQIELEKTDLGPLTSTLPANRSTLAPENLVRAMPRLISVLEGTDLAQFDGLVSQYTDAIIERIDPDQRWPDTPLCPLSGPAGCEQFVAAAPLIVACSVSGTLTAVFSTDRVTSGSQRSTTLRTVWEFDNNCVQGLDNNDGAVSLAGILETSVQTTTSVPSNRTLRFATYDGFQLTNASGLTTSLTGSWVTDEIQGSRDGTITNSRIGNFSENIELNNLELSNLAVGRSVISSQGNSQFSVGDPEATSLGFSINIPELGLNNIGVSVSTPLFTGFTRTVLGYRFSETRGVINLNAQDGSSAIITLSTDASGDQSLSSHTPGQELVNYQIMHDGIETTYQSDTSGFYIPTFVN